MIFFEYKEEDIESLSLREPILGAFIKKTGPVKRDMEPDPFAALVNSIISQQISGKAALRVREKFLKLTGQAKPENIIDKSPEDIKNCGMSLKKAGYIKNAAEKALSGEIDFSALEKMGDEETIRTLSSLKGVGRWSAEMVLIFSLGRKDVLSYNDLGIRKGMLMLYTLKELDKKTFQKYKELYSPFGTAASIYLWEAARVL